MKNKPNIVNLFDDKNIFSIKYIISISKEEDLNQFWSFVTISKNETHELVYMFLTRFYNFALSYMIHKKAEYFQIVLEESEDFFYFNLLNKKISKLFKKYLQKTSLNFIYNDKEISIKLKKLKYKEKIQKIEMKNKKREQNLIRSVTNANTFKKRVEPYNFITKEDLDYLLELSDDMQSLMIHSKKNGFTNNIFISLRSVISLFCLTLRYYDKISPIAVVITNFSNLINLNREKFIKLNEAELMLISGFISNIDYWLHTLFVNGGADLYFMDNSINADYLMIENLITPKYDENDLSIDDIFDF